MGYSTNQINIKINFDSVLKIILLFTVSTRRSDTEQRSKYRVVQYSGCLVSMASLECYDTMTVAFCARFQVIDMCQLSHPRIRLIRARERPVCEFQVTVLDIILFEGNDGTIVSTKANNQSLTVFSSEGNCISFCISFCPTLSVEIFLVLFLYKTQICVCEHLRRKQGAGKKSETYNSSELIKVCLNYDSHSKPLLVILPPSYFTTV